MSDIETVKFDIELSGTFKTKIPEFSIYINENKIIQDKVSDSKTFSFEVDLEENKEYTLIINFLNKNNYHDSSSFLNIEKITIDDIEIENLKWFASEFVSKDPRREKLDKCVNLGWNGRYQIKFTSPVYLWLLENL
jgi:hypothetical protein